MPCSLGVIGYGSAMESTVSVSACTSTPPACRASAFTTPSTRKALSCVSDCGRRERLGPDGRFVDDDLDEARAVAHHEKREAFRGAGVVEPAVERHALADVLGAVRRRA